MTSIKSIEAFYQVVYDLIEKLKKGNEHIYAKKLDDALSISTVVTEILFGLRIEILLILRDRETVDRLGIEQEANEAVDYLNRVLNYK